MTLAELVNTVAESGSLGKKEARAAVDAVFQALEDSLAKGDSVRTAFGTFSVVKRGPRTGRNIRTGETIKVPASKSVKFKPSKAVRERLNTSGGKRAAAKRGTAKSGAARGAAKGGAKTAKPAAKSGAKKSARR
jgi:DNA-binding protein HU-beta